jgi:heme/copper-type cytochrome/quinol oxidase subunit 3
MYDTNGTGSLQQKLSHSHLANQSSSNMPSSQVFRLVLRPVHVPLQSLQYRALSLYTVILIAKSVHSRAAAHTATAESRVQVRNLAAFTFLRLLEVFKSAILQR